jgi:putative transposase
MDDHFHALLMLRDAITLQALMRNFKRHSAREINRFIGRQGELWQAGYYEHAVRDEHDFFNCLEYMHANPVRRGWVERAADYEWPTAHVRRQADIDWNALGYGPD